MAATITGVVFNDANRNGTYDPPGDTGISNVSITLFDTTSICIATITSGVGVYTFGGIATAGTYKIYETVTTPTGCPPTIFTQPPGYNQSTTQRVQSIAVTDANIIGNATLTVNFGHEVITASIPCSATGIQFVTPASSLTTSYIEIDIVTGTPTNKGPILPVNQSYNGIGYSRVDNLIYGSAITPNKVARVQGNAIASILATVANLVAANVGDVDANGYLYLYAGGATRYYVVDVNSNRATFLKLVNPATGFTEQTSNFGVAIASVNIADWVISNVDSQIYAVSNNSNGPVVRINPLTGGITNLTTSGLPATRTIGAVFSTSNGQIYTIDNLTGRIYRITISGTTAVAEYFSLSVVSVGNDGASCASADLPIDFGDCPDTATVPFTSYHNYRSTLAKDGPRHGIIPQLVFGTGVTAEADALQNPTATGDSFDDGVGTLPIATMSATSITYVLPITVTNNTGKVANIYSWLDWNNNGVFEGNEAYTTTVASTVSGTQSKILTFTKPTSTTNLGGLAFIRMRITTDTLTNSNAGNVTLEDTRSYGPASNGEVEDYPLYIINTMSTNPQKTSDKNYADIGDTITYTLAIPNLGSTDMINVKIIDTIPNGSVFVANSVILNGVTVPGANPQPPTGYSIGTIPFSLTYTINFKVTVQSLPSPNNISNTFQLFYDYVPDVQTGITVPGTSTSTPPSSVTINTVTLVSTKTSTPTYVSCGTTITYTVVVKNNGTVSADNIVFQDTIPNQTQFIANSFTINGVSVPWQNPSAGINIGSIPAGTTQTLTFQVKSVC